MAPRGSVKVSLLEEEYDGADWIGMAGIIMRYGFIPSLFVCVNEKYRKLGWGTRLVQRVIEKKKGPGIWRAFFNGVFGALGYVVGVALVVVILGWILQKTGLLPAFKEQAKNFSDLINQAKKLTAPNDQNSTSSGGDSVITLPDGRQYRVNMQQ